MPNWSENYIKFENENHIDEFMTEENFDFNKLIPMPDYIYRGNLGQKEMEKYGDNNWYTWSNKNWGTKWNACYTSVDRDENVVIFSTAWCPPEPIFQKICSLYPEENIEFGGFIEDGVRFRYHNEHGTLEEDLWEEVEYDEEEEEAVY